MPKAKAKMRVQDREAKLDEALGGTFPASDPIAVGGATSTEPPSRPIDRKAPLVDLDDVAAGRRGVKYVSAA